MFPTGDFKRMKNDILSRYADYSYDEEITFGILIADYRQTEAREYILNYLQIFDNVSNKYFDFFIPGYSEYAYRDNVVPFTFRDKTYHFIDSLYMEFLQELTNYFNIDIPYEPVLLLVSMQKGHWGSAKYIAIQLNKIPDGIRQSGKLFQRIFEVAKSSPSLKSIRNEYKKTYIRGNLLDSILSFIQDNIKIPVKAIKTNYDIAQMFKING